MFDVTILPNGDLELAADAETREYIAECQKEGKDYWSIMFDLFEPYSTNGEYTPFDAGQANPFVGLTSAPCIAESMDYPDDGNHEIVGRLWWYPDYMIRDDLGELRDTGRVAYTLAGEG